MSVDVSKLTSAPLPDVCRNKHQGNTESELSNIRVQSRKKVDRERILAFATMQGSYGITLHEVCAALHIKVQSASARLSECKANHELVPNGEKREHAGVFIVPKGQMSLL
jgi:hypothetical protein